MTLEEAIKQSEDIADANERIADIYKNHDKDFEEARRSTTEYYRQLAEWLKALKEIWDSGDCNDCRNGQCEWKPELGQLVRYNCPHYVGIANEEVKAEGGCI